MKSRLRLCGCALMTVLCTSASEYMFKPITLNDGLSQNSVKTILHDYKGYLWMGTKYGLNRYDHRGITTYFADATDPYTITNNDVHTVFEDSRRNIWVSGENGVARYDRQYDRFEKVTIAGRPINTHSYCETPDGLLMGGGGRLYFYDYNHKEPALVDVTGGSSMYYNRIQPWVDGSYLLETRWDGLWVYDPAKRHIDRFEACQDKNIMASCVDTEGNLWVSPYGEGLRCYNAAGRLIYEAMAGTSKLNSNIIIDLLESNGSLWIATEVGVDILDIDTGQFSYLDNYGTGSSIGTVLSLYKDDLGNIYAGTLRHGVMCIYTVPMRTYINAGGEGSASDFTVTSLYEDKDGTVWCGIDGDGVVRLDPVSDRFTRYPSTAGLKVTWVTAYNEESLLITTFVRGAFLLDKRSGRLSPAPQPYPAFVADNAKKALAMEAYSIDQNRDAIVTDMLYVVDRRSGSYRAVKTSAEGMRSGKVYVFYHNDRRMLMFSTVQLLQYDISGDTLTPLVSLPNGENVKCAQFDGRRTIYLGTNKGLYRYDVIDKKLMVIEAPYIHNITAMAIDGARLWIGADNVLYALHDGNLRAFNSYDGVSANEFINKAVLVTDKYVFMGGINGLQKIDRAMIGEMDLKADAIAMSLSDIIIDGVSHFASVEDGHINVPSTHSSVEVKIIDREQNAMRSKLFRFYVEGLDRNSPIETFDRMLTLNMLPSGGTYKISVSCSLPDGSWTDPIEIVELRVSSPWWKSWWSILLYLLIGALIGYSAYRYIYQRKQRQLDDFKRKTLEREVGFLSNINYELRTPLSLIYAPLKLLISRLKRAEHPDTETITDLEKIYRHTKEMRDVINMPLELWHVEASGSGTPPVRCDFNAWLQREVEASAAAIGLRRMHVSYELDGSIGDVTFDRTRMGMVLSNMLMAAIKHSPRGSTLGVASQLAGPCIRVEIHDQGESLSEAEINRVFSGHYNNHLYGAGLGLAYAKMLMELQHGRVGVVSHPDKGGVTIWLELPREPKLANFTPEEAMTEELPDTPPMAGLVDAYDASSSTAIVVEDNEELCMFMMKHLKGVFKKVYCAFNGRDGLMMIKRDSPDIVIADGVLPVMSGFDLCRDIKSSAEMQHIPVILLTAGSAEIEKLKSYNLGADSYISKPFDVNVLVSRCKNLLLNREIVRKRYRNVPGVMPVEEKKLSNADESFLMKIDQLIADGISSPEFGVDTIVDKMLMSRSALYSRFKDLTGKSIGTYVTEYRLGRAKEMLMNKASSINEIAEALGFRSQRYFSTFFKERTGSTPSAYRASIVDKSDDNKTE